MVFNRSIQESRLVRFSDTRPPREKDPGSCLRAEVQTTKPVGTSKKVQEVEVQLSIERVSVYSEVHGEFNKTLYSVVLELDPQLNPSSRTRRTETVKGLALSVEEKELVGLARLSGRSVILYIERGLDTLDFEGLEEDLRARESEIKALRRKNESLAEQLQFAMEQITRDSR